MRKTQSHRKKVTILAYFFPPIAAIGYKRPLRLAKNLLDAGNRVTLYCAHTKTLPGVFSTDDTLICEIDSRIRIKHPYAIHGFDYLIQFRDAHRKSIEYKTSTPPENKTKRNRESRRKPKSLNLLIIDKIMDLFSIPDRFISWVLTATPMLLLDNLILRSDTIIVTAPPWSPILAAVIAGNILNIPVYIDYRDPWTLNPYSNTPSKCISSRLERWAVRHAEGIIGCTQSITDLFQCQYPELPITRTVYNSIDKNELQQIQSLREQSTGRIEHEVAIAHVGTLYRQRMPLKLAELLADIAVQWNGTLPLKFYFIGNIEDPDTLCRPFCEKRVENMLNLVGQVSAIEAKRRIVQSSVLLLLQSGTNIQVPAKIFEYALSNVPILCVADEESETANIVSSYNLGIIVSPATPAESIVSFIKERSDLKDRAKIGQFLTDFDGSNLAEEMARIILPDS